MQTHKLEAAILETTQELWGGNTPYSIDSNTNHQHPHISIVVPNGTVVETDVEYTLYANPKYPHLTIWYDGVAFSDPQPLTNIEELRNILYDAYTIFE